jgi:hypothetical protein
MKGVDDVVYYHVNNPNLNLCRDFRRGMRTESWYLAD